MSNQNNELHEIPGLAQYLPNIKLIPIKEGYCKGLGRSNKYTICGNKLSRYDAELATRGVWSLDNQLCDACQAKSAAEDDE